MSLDEIRFLTDSLDSLGLYFLFLVVDMQGVEALRRLLRVLLTESRCGPHLHRSAIHEQRTGGQQGRQGLPLRTSESAPGSRGRAIRQCIAPMPTICASTSGYVGNRVPLRHRDVADNIDAITCDAPIRGQVLSKGSLTHEAHITIVWLSRQSG